LKDSAYSFIDNIETAQTETIKDLVTAAFKMPAPVLEKAEAGINWNGENIRTPGWNT